MIYLDLSIFGLQPFGGIATVWREYLRRLPEHFGPGEVTLVAPLSALDEVFSLNAGRYEVVPSVPRGRVSKYFPSMISGASGAVVHGSYYQTYPFFEGSKIVTVHDLTYAKHAIGLRRSVHGLLMRRAVESADVVTCPSEATKADVLELLPASRQKPLYVIPHAVDPLAFFPSAASGEEPKTYLLWIGRRDWYRDFKNAVKVVAALAEAGLDLSLRVVGKPLSDDEQRLVEREGVESRVQVVGEVRRDELRELYAGAFALLYLSQNEGFGLPILEAQRCVCPVICYPTGACSEVGGDGVSFVDRGSVTAIARALLKLRDGERRSSLVHRGANNAARFEWDASVTRLADIYRALRKKNSLKYRI